MKKIKYILILTVVSLMSFSCDSFFDVDFDDQATLEQIFSERIFTHRYLAQLYSWIPLDEEIVGSEGFVVPRSDEAQFTYYQWVNYHSYRNGSNSAATTYFHTWDKFYKAINECSIFIEHVDLDLEDNAEVRSQMKAEARFLRAYYYFCLFRQYGPVFIWGDRSSDSSIKNVDVDRHTVDENVQFMIDELDTAIAALAPTIGAAGENEATWMGRVTKGAAMALKARILIYAASPLYNGCDLYKNKMKNKDGNYLFPQTPDPSKWTAAYEAAKAVIDLGQYELYESAETDPMKKAIASVQGAAGVFNDSPQYWNSEVIWGWWKRTSSAYSYLYAAAPITNSAPPGVILHAHGAACPSLKLVDSYPMMESGRYPVQGYEKTDGRNDYSKPIVDPLSGYQTEGFTENYVQPDAEWAEPIKAHNSTVGRDPRFYAHILPNGFWWPNKNRNQDGKIIKFLYFDNPDLSSDDPMRWRASGDGSKVGYAMRKFYPTNKPLATATDYSGYRTVHPYLRLSEIYLICAEACNEMPNRNGSEACGYVNKIRNRAGLNNIEEAYPGIENDKELLRWVIQKENMIEFAFEAHRHYDACRWMVAKDEYPADNWTLRCSATNYEDVYARVSNELTVPVANFSDKDYLFPISSSTIAQMTNMTQNYGF